MNQFKAGILQNSKSEGQFNLTLRTSDVFLSFHYEKRCAALHLTQDQIANADWKKLLNEACRDLEASAEKIEVKVVANHTAFKKVEIHLTAFASIKKVLRLKSTEIQFLPAQNKIRVAIEEAPKMEVGGKIKVMVVDDSKTIRNLLSRIFQSDSEFELVATAEKPSDVEQLIQQHRPDVITLDIHMPEMDGVTLLKTLITPKYQIPTVMITSISMQEGPMVLDALEHGAVDYIQKPEMSEISTVSPLILEKVKVAARSRKKPQSNRNAPAKKVQSQCNLDSLIVLGASTGGTEAIREILTAMPSEIPPILIVQHIPAMFSLAFAKRMNELCPFSVKEAKDGDLVVKNQVLIAPGGTQMKMVHKAGKTYIEITDDAPVNRFKPSVDYMFNTVCENLYTHTVGVLLTGMGKDGARGLLALRNKGVQTIAQNEETSIVFGMPKEAIEIGGAEYVEALQDIAQRITQLTHENRHNKKDSVA